MKSDPQGLHRSVFEMDNIHTLRAMDSDSVDLIYLDPPFNSNKLYSAPIGSPAAGAAFKDAWTLSDVDLADHNRLKRENPGLYALIYSSGKAHSQGMFSYLIMMAPRLIEMHRVLKPTGSIYLHCDPTASHYLKVLMDLVFGRSSFRNDIVWRRRHGMSSRVHTAHKFGVSNDNVLFYAKRSAEFQTPYTFDDPDYQAYLDRHFKHRTEDGRRYRIDNLANPAPRPNLMYDYKGYPHPPNGWAISREKMELWDREGRLEFPKKKTGRIQRRRFLDEVKGKPIQSIWTDIASIESQSAERTGYPTQKPLALLERIIQASSKEGDLVLDPFCGCATTMVAAELLDRKWCGIDVYPLAAELVVQRIREKRSLFKFQDISHRQTIPIRTDLERRMVKRGKEWEAHKVKLFDEQEGRCNLCFHVFAEPEHPAMDHILPQNKGGKDWEDNLQLLCARCNSIKGTGTQEEARGRLVERRGFDFTAFEERSRETVRPPVLPGTRKTSGPRSRK